jgi:hypothetical protein
MGRLFPLPVAANGVAELYRYPSSLLRTRRREEELRNELRDEAAEKLGTPRV